MREVKTLSSIRKGANLNIYWFRNTDLRLHDNPALLKGLSNSKEDGLLPVFCFDKRTFGSKCVTEFGSMKIGPRRAQFLIESVTDLRKSVEKMGGGLYVSLCTPEEMFSQLTMDKEVVSAYCQEEIASEELNVGKRVNSILKQKSGKLHSIWGSTLYHPDDLPFYGGIKDLPDTFTPFRNKVEKKCEIGASLSAPKEMKLPIEDLLPKEIESGGFKYMPTLSDLGYDESDIAAESTDKRGVMKFEGGETAALARLKDYIWDKDLLKVYFDTRNGMIGADYSSKFAPWLALGCLSPRYVASQCTLYEQKRVANKSTYWLVFELLWRDFFRFFGLKHGNSIFKLDGTLGDQAHGSHPNSRRWSFDKRYFQAWKEGKTGYPLVDANMRELAATGFMSNRGRQNVASFLAIDLSMDWRYGADHFESLLLDYDICSNWGNWCSAAGMTGGRLNRFNIAKQGKDYDPNGDYIKLWCPELKDVPPSLIHEPWKMNKDQQEEYNVKLGTDYPKPIPTIKFNPPRSNAGGERRGKKFNDRKQGNSNKPKQMKSLKQGNYRISSK